MLAFSPSKTKRRQHSKQANDRDIGSIRLNSAAQGSDSIRDLNNTKEPIDSILDEQVDLVRLNWRGGREEDRFNFLLNLLHFAPPISWLLEKHC